MLTLDRRPRLRRYVRIITVCGALCASLAVSITSALASLFTSQVPPGFTWSKPHDGWSIGVISQGEYTWHQPMLVRLAIRNVSRHTMDGERMECLRLDAQDEDGKAVPFPPPGLWGCDESMPMGDARRGDVYVEQWDDLAKIFIWPKPGRYCVTASGFGGVSGSPGPAHFCFNLVAAASEPPTPSPTAGV